MFEATGQSKLIVLSLRLHVLFRDVILEPEAPRTLSWVSCSFGDREGEKSFHMV
jgi:hypothetical protein